MNIEYLTTNQKLKLIKANNYLKKMFLGKWYKKNLITKVSVDWNYKSALVIYKIYCDDDLLKSFVGFRDTYRECIE